jgi:GNAT superfamily N-acetyltransferase
VSIAARFKRGIARYDPGDATALAEFQRRAFGPGSRQLDGARFDWLFEHNPCATDGPGLWICRRDGAVVGQQGEIPFDLLVDGAAHRATWAIDLMVDEAWRLRGVGPALVDTLLGSRRIVAAVCINTAAQTMYRRTGWTDLGVVPVYLRPLRARGILRLAPDAARPLRVLGAVATPALHGLDTALGAALRLRGVRLVPVERFDGRVDEIWSACAHEYPVLAARDAATTRWRLDERPDAERLRRYYLRRRNRALGYIALRAERRRGEPVVAVVDYLAPRRWVAPLIAAAAAQARADGAVAMKCKTLNPAADRELRAAGFVKRDRAPGNTPIRFMVRCRAEEPVCARLTDRRAWLVTAADSDQEIATADDTLA